jgi:drug/metabolite transporter (DMT)-like permease
MQMRMGYLAVLFSSLCFGFLGYFGKVGYTMGYTPLTLLTARFVLAAVVLWAFALVKGGGGYRVTRQELPGLAAQGVGYAMTALGYFYALRYLSASLVAIIFYVHPVITTLAATVIFKEPLNRFKVGALVMAIAGTTLVSDPWAMRSGALAPAGLLWIAVAACSYSFFTILGQKTTNGRDSLVVTTYAITFCGLFLSLLNPPLYLFNGSMTVSMWWVAFGIGFISSVLAILFYVVGISIIGASRTSIVAAAEPLSGLVVAALLLGDRLAGWQWLGIALILVAVAVLQLDRQPQAKSAA